MICSASYRQLLAKHGATGALDGDYYFRDLQLEQLTYTCDENIHDERSGYNWDYDTSSPLHLLTQCHIGT